MRILREQLQFFVIVPLIIFVMTWPTLYYVFETQTFWLAGNDIDTNMLFWDAWYFKRLLASQADYFFTDLLFHPEGVSLAFHNFSLPHMVLFAGSQAIMPAPNAYNLTFLILIFLMILSGYTYIHYLFQDKWISLFGALVFGGSGFVTSRPAHPYTWFVAILPLSLYFMQRGIQEGRVRFMIVAGALLGISGFISMYTVVCMLLTLGVCVLYFALSRWRDRRFWLNLLLLTLVAGAILLLRVYPMLVDAAGLSDALGKTAGREYDNDLVAFFANYANPLTGPAFEAAFGPNRLYSSTYLGYLPFILVLIGLATWRNRRDTIFWLLLLLMFLVLRLGSTLTVGGVAYKSVLLPKFVLDEVFPYLFKPFWNTQNFHAGALLPLAILACYGMTRVLRSLRGRRRALVSLALVVALGVEHFRAVEPTIIPEAQFDFLDWLKQEEDQDAIRLINLPMGGQNSKYYAFFQTYNGYPHAEGRPTRTPDSAFQYIEDNALLSAWRGQLSYHCLPGNREDYHAALDQLLADDFSHILLHKWRALKVVHLHRFAGVAPAYDDHFVTIYRVKDLRGGCENTALVDLGPRFILQDGLAPGSNLPETGAAVLSIHPNNAGAGGLSDYYAAAAERPQQLLPVALADLRAGRQLNREMRRYDPNTILEDSSVFLLVYDPRRSDPDRLETYREWLSGRLQSCGREPHGADVVLEYFVGADFACSLLMDGQPRQVAYENSIELGNMHYEVAGDRLELRLLWRSLPEETHSISVQFVDGEGARVGGQDFVIGHEPLERHAIDLSNLAPGEYVAKLILYNFETLASAPGRLTGSDQRFERELDLAQLSLE